MDSSDLDLHLIHGSWTLISQLPNGISMSLAIFAGLANMPNRLVDTQTDWPHYSVCSNSSHLMQCVRCGLKMLIIYMLVMSLHWLLDLFVVVSVPDELVWAAVYQLHEREASAAVQPHDVHHRAGGIQTREHRVEVYWLWSRPSANHRPHWEGERYIIGMQNINAISDTFLTATEPLEILLPLWLYMQTLF